MDKIYIMRGVFALIAALVLICAIPALGGAAA
jgi:hypothetical protein